MKSMAPIPACAASSKPAASATCSRSALTAGWSPAPAPCAPIRWPRPCRAAPGSSAPPGPREGTTPLRLGAGRDRRRPARAPVAAHPAQPHYRRAGLLPVLLATAGATIRAGHRGRTAVDRRRRLSYRQGPVRPGPAPGPALGLLAPLDHPVHARPRIPRRSRRHRTINTIRPRPNPDDLQRNPAPAQQPDHQQEPRPAHCLRWSNWRRRHRHHARTYHYRRRNSARP